MVRKQKLVLRFALGLLLVGCLCLSILSHREPSYNGKCLSKWALQYAGSHNWNGENLAADQDAEFAIQQIGTNGIPFLLNLMQKPDSALKAGLRRIFPQKWHYKVHLLDYSGKIRRAGAFGIVALGTNAVTALPCLARI